MRRCGRCGRTLTNDHSVSVGFGPVCRNKIGWYSGRIYTSSSIGTNIVRAGKKYLQDTAKDVAITAALHTLTIINPPIGITATALYTGYTYLQNVADLAKLYKAYSNNDATKFEVKDTVSETVQNISGEKIELAIDKEISTITGNVVLQKMSVIPLTSLINVGLGTAIGSFVANK